MVTKFWKGKPESSLKASGPKLLVKEKVNSEAPIGDPSGTTIGIARVLWSLLLAFATRRSCI